MAGGLGLQISRRLIYGKETMRIVIHCLWLLWLGGEHNGRVGKSGVRRSSVNGFNPLTAELELNLRDISINAYHLHSLIHGTV